MILTKLHIENFGTLHDFDYDFNDNLNQICEQNGWGKSTFGVFLKAMFFGMSAKARGDAVNYERSKYMPWQGGNFGGFIEFLYQNQPYRLTRYFGKTPEGDSQELMNLTTMKPTKNPNNEIGEVIFGVGGETFEITAYFPQLNFMPASNGQIKAELTGANKFQDDLAGIERAIKQIETKSSQTKKELHKKEEVESEKIALNQNVALQNLQKENCESLENELKSQEERLNSRQKLLEAIKSKNMLIQEKIVLRRNIENDIQQETEKLSKVLIAKGEETEKEKNMPKNKRPIILSALFSLFALAGFGILSYFKLVAGLIGLGASLILGAIFWAIAIKKSRPKIIHVRDFEKEITDVTKHIDELKSELDKFDNELEIEDESELNAQISALSIDYATKKANMLGLEKDIARLEKEEEELLYRLNKMENENSSTSRKLDILAKAKQFLLQAQENVSQRFIVPLNDEFKTLLKQFHFINKDFVVDSGLDIKENTVYGQKALGYSSQGIRDILSFCQRVNLATKIYKKEKPFIFLDDTFVNLDDENLTIAKQLVKNLSNDYQVIYICCNSRCKID